MATKKERQELMRRRMRTLALRFDADARFTILAPNLGVNVNAIMRWIHKGYMPLTTARGLESRFGADLAPADDLSRE
jgi:hypothetical protein